MTTTLMLTVEEAAAELHMGRTWVFGLIRDHKLVSVKLGSKRLIRRSDLERFIEALPAESP